MRQSRRVPTHWPKHSMRKRARHAQPVLAVRLAQSRALRGVAAVGIAALLTVSSLVAGGSPSPVGHAEDNVVAGPAPTGTILNMPAETPPASAAAPRPRPAPELPAASGLAADGIPASAMDAYRRAAIGEQRSLPACGLSWPLLAAVGRVESDHGRADGAVLYVNGVSLPHIVGIALDGHGAALVRDTDHGRLDGDAVYDHAVGPMQFIPSTWALYGVDGNGDRHIDPFNLFDAAATAARYLCAAGGDLTTLAGQTAALLAYNHTTAYAQLVIGLEAVYAKAQRGLVVPALAVLPTTNVGRIAPADPSAPLGLGASIPAAAPTPGSARTPTPGSPSVSEIPIATPSPTGPPAGPPTTVAASPTTPSAPPSTATTPSMPAPTASATSIVTTPSTSPTSAGAP